MTFDSAGAHIRAEYAMGERYILVPKDVYDAYSEGCRSLYRINTDPRLAPPQPGAYYKDAKVTYDSKGNR